MDSLNFNSVETLPNLSARAAFQVNSSAVFKEDVDIVPVVIDDTLSYMPWGGRLIHACWSWATCLADIQDAIDNPAERHVVMSRRHLPFSF